MSKLIETYLEELEQKLTPHVGAERREEILRELRSHLWMSRQAGIEELELSEEEDRGRIDGQRNSDGGGSDSAGVRAGNKVALEAHHHFRNVFGAGAPDSLVNVCHALQSAWHL